MTEDAMVMTGVRASSGRRWMKDGYTHVGIEKREREGGTGQGDGRWVD